MKVPPASKSQNMGTATGPTEDLRSLSSPEVVFMILNVNHPDIASPQAFFVCIC